MVGGGRRRQGYNASSSDGGREARGWVREGWGEGAGSRHWTEMAAAGDDGKRTQFCLGSGHGGWRLQRPRLFRVRLRWLAAAKGPDRLGSGRGGWRRRSEPPEPGGIGGGGSTPSRLGRGGWRRRSEPSEPGGVGGGGGTYADWSRAAVVGNNGVSRRSRVVSVAGVAQTPIKVGARL